MGILKLSLWGALVASAAAYPDVPTIDITLLGPVYQAAQDPTLQAWADAKKQATDALNQVIATGNNTYGALDTQGTSFSASVFDLTSNEPLFEFHFEAPTLNGSYTKGKLSADTIYRTGSLGKLLTIYTWLVDIGDDVYNDPITKYVPELAAAAQGFTNPLLQTNWSEVTVGALASQISGIGRDFTLGDLAQPSLQSPPVSANIPQGFPPLTNESVIPCSAYSIVLPTCSRAQFLDGVINHPPVFVPYKGPSYSNLAFAILGFAYETITGKNISQGQIDVFQGTLGMKSTSPNYPGPQADAIIPRNDSYALFSYDIGVQGPAGNQYISTRDLWTWGKAIMNNTLIPGYRTRKWMKPHTFTANWASAVGAPWEIYRLAVPIDTRINGSRIVDTYTKSGDIGLYSTYFGIVPDYSLGVTVLAAGDSPNRQVPPVRGVLVDIYYKAAEAAAKAQAKNAFTGTFAAKSVNSSITLTIDGGPGVFISSWISNSSDFLAGAWAGGADDFRLYPTLLSYQSSGDPLVYWKYHLAKLPNGGAPTNGDPWNEFNEYWIQDDGPMYNNLAVDAFVVGMDAQGKVQSVESQALRTTYYRI